MRFIEALREFNQKENTQSIHRARQLRASGKKPGLYDLQANRTNLVSIVCYCLNPNHYHLLLQQAEEKGIEKFMHRLGLSYSRYFNVKYKRSGSLFQGPYKSVGIKKNTHLMYASCYINGNPEIHGISKADQWIYSSCLDYLGKRNGTLCDKDEVIAYFKGVNDYRETMQYVIENAKNIKVEMKYMIME